MATGRERLQLLLGLLTVAAFAFTAVSDLSPVRGWPVHLVRGTHVEIVRTLTRAQARKLCDPCETSTADVNGIRLSYPNVMVRLSGPIPLEGSDSILVAERRGRVWIYVWVTEMTEDGMARLRVPRAPFRVLGTERQQSGWAVMKVRGWTGHSVWLLGRSKWISVSTDTGPYLEGTELASWLERETERLIDRLSEDNDPDSGRPRGLRRGTVADGTSPS